MSDGHKLLRGLELHAASRPRPIKAEECCSYCGAAKPGRLVLLPAAGICEQCASLAAGMFLVAGRDGLSLASDYRLIFQRALQEYFHHEGEIPRLGRAQQP